MKRQLFAIVGGALASTFAFVASSAAQVPSTQFKSDIGKAAPSAVDEVARGDAIADDLNWSYVDDNPIVDQRFTTLTKKHIFSGVYGRGGLTPRQREMVVIAIIITQGVGSGLEWHVKEAAHRAGVSEDEFREIIYTSCFYAGWPKCGQAEKMIDEVLAGPNTWPKELRSKNPRPVRYPSTEEEIARGREIAQRLGWLTGNPLSQGFKNLTTKNIFANVYARTGLTLKEREMVIIPIIITQGVPFGLSWHVAEAAHRVGISEDEFRELIYTSCFYAGWPKCGQAEKQIDEVMAGKNTWPAHLRSKVENSGPSGQ